ncbi:helicase-associated domain-containing protein [Nonomuraea sp. NPDC059007]|uniref:helicase-associated domain-containing protein n=1 Tax=Nonomuraea sp. NPDC059007 TaxID=3346692 RepID=UPI003676C2A0
MDVQACTLPEYQILAAISWAAAERHGPLPPASWWRGARPVPEADVLRMFEPAALRAVKAQLTSLAERKLLHRSAGELDLPAEVRAPVSGGLKLGRPAADLIDAYFNAAEVHQVAAGLGFAKAANRTAARNEIVATLTEPSLLGGVLALAPPDAAELLETLAFQGPYLGTHVFVATSPYGHTKYTFRDGGGGDPATDWLAARGLVLPSGQHDLAELPAEVAMAVRGDRLAPFDPLPPAPPPDSPAVTGVRAAAQAQATAFAGQLERVLGACAATPLTIRKNGGVAVRDTKRVAKSLGLDEEIVRFCVDLCFAADLLGGIADPVEKPPGRRRAPAPAPTVRVVPTAAYDEWLGRTPAGRLLPAITAWATLPGLLTWWPDGEEAPVAIAFVHDPAAPDLRLAMLEALAVIPGGHGLDERLDMAYLLEAVSWHRPFLVDGSPESLSQMASVMNEAEHLGVTAHGALTDLGRAALELLRSGAAYPQVLSEPPPALASALAELLPAPATTARFQADLTAVVSGPPEASLAELLGSAATRESEGHAVVWRFSAASVRRALDAGTGPDELLASLAAVARGELPQPLVYLVNDVGRTHGRMRVVRSGCCVRSDDEALLAELAAARSLRRLGLRRIAPTVLISAGSERETLEALRAAGYTPALEAETGATVLELDAVTRAPRRFS